MQSQAIPSVSPTATETEAILFVRDLIRIRSVNTGDPRTMGDGEAVAAAYIRERLGEVGLDSIYIEPAPGRGNVVCRIKGSDSDQPALILHAHVDVVPADETEWSVPPFAGEIKDGMLYGRGAVDMKNMAGLMVALARSLARDRFIPKRDIIFMWFSDEENGSVHGSQWLTEKERHLFDGASEAISEVGGFSITLPNGKRAYPLATAEKGVARMKLTARGTAGHGALINGDNALTRLAAAVERIGTHKFPIHRTPHLNALIEGLEKLLGKKFDDERLDEQLDELGFFASTIRASLRNTANPTMLNGGYKRNVIPSTAEAVIDGRVLPGTKDEFVRQVTEIVGPGIDIEWTFGWTIESPVEGPLMDKMRAAIEAEDPEGTVIPYLLPGGTDNKLLSKIGINGYGFVPMKVPADFDVWGLFHAVDERIPVDALTFGVRVLGRLLRDS
ncbi:M20/M25/M40 family metallo-hydrolase [Mesorhizobium sp. B2-3-5]|uniref:M20/M25/M40 family metallo-hydrolase n=1 Tax=Mesorhizobium sp. B2-3-5 TaxID=2589958 RepID=UPI00112E740A|nr:M20/M25/M40 family metallo-hydrolase [Mesorhizobium sp. B2-3-5]TPM24815.1 M20/M25/M40 family metallo-hydrolase [Mesorhizobium sp. B2-3-5]